MAMPRWFMREKRPADKNRDPHLSEFFATATIKNYADALSRESNQNSLDASGKNPLLVRVFLSEAQGALPWQRVKPYVTDLWPHLQANDSGLRNKPQENAPCQFLLIEDFGTTGLTGDTAQWDIDTDKEKNPFFYFFRAEGISAKSEKDRGRWGIGKYVFPRSSQAHTFFGYTIRQTDGRRLLLGQTVLRHHRVNGKPYTPDGMYGIEGKDELVLPCEDEGFLKGFLSDFRISRKAEPGLSIIVPWYDPDITFARMVSAAASQYFYPILSGKMSIEVATPAEKRLLSADTLLNEIEKLEDSLILKANAEIAKWALGISEESRFACALQVDGAPSWGNHILSAELAEKARTELNIAGKLAFRIPIRIRQKKEKSEDGYFDVYIVRDSSKLVAWPVFIRDGIIISDVRVSRTPGFRAIVVTESAPLSRMLGDSENPAHTQWQEESSNFKGKYEYGPSCLRFVRSAVSEILGLINEGVKVDRSVLAHLFSVPAAPENPDAVQVPAEKDAGGEKRKPPLPPVPPGRKARRCLVSKIKKGFSVKFNDGPLTKPFTVAVRAAYDVRNGNPFSHYSPSDFDLKDMKVELTDPKGGTKITSRTENTIHLQVEKPGMVLLISGFDEHRDLVIDIDEKEQDDAAAN